ncbi:aminoglycoside phosphotransferase family protein [Streptomyces sp. NPDC051940]|uniref:aminoglycoside phosphotransferase family protein n=1 Tax=Streptomyces sp. NPDC051940 TaxID=3155675 RepID=UPI0034126A02
MPIETTVSVDRGDYEDTATPWDQDLWRAEALAWVAGGLAAHGLRADGERAVRLRPWSVLVRVAVAGGGAVWFKANPPASAFEGPLTAALAAWVPQYVLRPLAVDAVRGWSLLPDGGDLFRTVLGREGLGLGAWEDLVCQYGRMQRALTPYAGEMEQLGVPSARTAALPEVFDRLVAANTALDADRRAALKALRPRLADWCAELADLGVADSLDHSDLHDGQLFRPAPGRYTFFDWGDAAVSHPFCSLMVPAARAREDHGPDALFRLRDAYLEPWTGHGRTPAELRRAVSLAWRLSALGRADSWGRFFPGASGGAGEEARAHWLMRLADEPPL